MGVTAKSVLPVEKVQHGTGGGHRPMVRFHLLWKRPVPTCLGVILDRATSRAVLRTRVALLRQPDRRSAGRIDDGNLPPVDRGLRPDRLAPGQVGLLVEHLVG